MEVNLDNLKKIRKELGITQKQLSKICGVSQSYITKIESGILDPSYSNAKKILDSINQIIHKREVKAKDVMFKKIISVEPNKSIKDAIVIMRRNDISQLPVIHDHRLLGYVNEKRLLDVLISNSNDKKIEDIMLLPPPTVDEEAPLEMLKDLLKYWPIVLVKNDRKYVGIISKSDLLLKLIKR